MNGSIEASHKPYGNGAAGTEDRHEADATREDKEREKYKNAEVMRESRCLPNCFESACHGREENSY